MTKEGKTYKGSWLDNALIQRVEYERRRTVPRLTWTQMVEKIVAERYSKKASK